MTFDMLGPDATESWRFASDSDAYQAGYVRTLREMEIGQSLGWSPTERQLVVALSRAVRVYSTARHGKPIGGQHPEWLRGRADALRALLQQGVGFEPTTNGE